MNDDAKMKADFKEAEIIMWELTKLYVEYKPFELISLLDTLDGGEQLALILRLVHTHADAIRQCTDGNDADALEWINHHLEGARNG